MTYGELNSMPAGWVTSHAIGDICSNARYALGKNSKALPVSEYDIKQIIATALHFGEPVPSALQQFQIAA